MSKHGQTNGLAAQHGIARPDNRMSYPVSKCQDNGVYSPLRQGVSAKAMQVQADKLTDEGRVNVLLPPDYKRWFEFICQVEKRNKSQQGRVALIGFVDSWKQEHPEKAAAIEKLLTGAKRETDLVAAT